MRRTDNWRPKYYLALILWSRNELARARDLLTQCGNAPDFAPFYAARSKAFEAVSRDQALADLRRAAELDPREWRYGKLLTERLIEDKAFGAALETVTRYFKASPANYMLGMLHARTLVLNQRYAEAADSLAKLNVLPYEGATDGRALYRETQLMLAAADARARKWTEAAKRVAAAREWPEHLGAGKPYAENVDERLEDRLQADCLARLGRAAESLAILSRLGPPSKPAAPGSLESRVLAAWPPLSK
jgi:predicted Zn-dependent protease